MKIPKKPSIFFPPFFLHIYELVAAAVRGGGRPPPIHGKRCRPDATQLGPKHAFLQEDINAPRAKNGRV